LEWSSRSVEQDSLVNLRVHCIEKMIILQDW
jgi:hypothetical protein